MSRIDRKKILVLGANSGIAQETIRIFIEKKCDLYLVARNEEKLNTFINTLSIDPDQKIETQIADLTDLSRHEGIIENALSSLGDIDIVFLAYGVLPDRIESTTTVESALHCIEANFTSAVSLITPIANLFEKQKRGEIVVITSIAGDRGRKRNYVYGSAKAGMSIYLEGLRGRLFESGVHVLTIKPGFVDTPMTSELKKNVLFAHPKPVAKKIFRAIEKKKDVLYVPSFWSLIMFVVNHLPHFLMKRISF